MYASPPRQARRRSPRRPRASAIEAVVAPPIAINVRPGRVAPAFDPQTSTWFVDVAGAELEAATLADLRTKLPAGWELAT